MPNPTPMTAAQFASELQVGPTELERLKRYLALLERWRGSINLVGPGSMADPWRRHMLDSGQLVPLLPPTGEIMDLGTGPGFPGLVIAILSGRRVVLVESNARKCAFLAEVVRATSAPATIQNARIESLSAAAIPILVSRALAPVALLLELAEHLIDNRTVALLLKGKEVQQELTAAAKTWKYDAAVHQSCSDPHGRVVQLERISRRHV